MTFDTGTDPIESEQTVHHLQLEFSEAEDPSLVFVRTLASIKGVKPDELDPLHTNLDHLVNDVVESPPPGENQAQIAFSYEGFRVTLYHDGHAVFREIA